LDRHGDHYDRRHDRIHHISVIRRIKNGRKKNSAIQDNFSAFGRMHFGGHAFYGQADAPKKRSHE
jgi:hypothetical protein